MKNPVIDYILNAVTKDSDFYINKFGENRSFHVRTKELKASLEPSLIIQDNGFFDLIWIIDSEMSDSPLIRKILGNYYGGWSLNKIGLPSENRIILKTGDIIELSDWHDFIWDCEIDYIISLILENKKDYRFQNGYYIPNSVLRVYNSRMILNKHFSEFMKLFKAKIKRQIRMTSTKTIRVKNITGYYFEIRKDNVLLKNIKKYYLQSILKSANNCDLD